MERLAVFSRTLNSAYLKDDGVARTAHNEKAQILRNGISIIAFTLLEDFIKQRTGEALESISASPIQFRLLSEKLQKAVTVGAMKSIAERASNMEKANEDWLSFVQTEAQNIATTANFPYSLSRFSLGWDKSNLGKEDVTRMMKVFNVAGGWDSIQKITAKANVSLMAPETVFSNAAQRRHKAAHDPAANSLYSDLDDYSRDVKSLSFAYDVLISKGAQHIITRNPLDVTPDLIHIRFVTKDGGIWKEFNSTSKKALKVDTNYHRLLAKVLSRTKRRGEVLVVKKTLREIHAWFVH